MNIPAPKGPPNPVLSKLGFTGDGQEFLSKLKSYTVEYEQQFGYKPSPDKALADAIAGTVPKPVVVQKAASSGERYRQQLASIEQGKSLIEKAQSTMDDPDVVKAVASAARVGRAAEVVGKRVADIKALPMDKRLAVAAIVRAKDDMDVVLPWQVDPSQNDPKKAAPMTLDDNVVAFRIRQDLKAGEITRADALAQWVSHNEEMRQKINNPGSVLGKVVSLPGVAAEQIATSLVNSPGGLYATGEAVALDAADAFQGKAPTRTPKIAKGMITQIWEDVKNPLDRPGYLFLDILGVAGGGAGAVSRTGSALATAKAGGSAGAVAKAALKRPVGGSFALEIGDSTAYVRLSDNPARAFVQKWRLAGKQARTDAARDGTSAGALHAVMPPKVERVLSAERTARKAWDRDAAIQQVIDMEGSRELKQAAGWVRDADSILSKVTPERFRGLSVGEQKLIFSSALDDPTPIATQIKAHQNLIRDGVGEMANHQANIEALYLAADIAKKSGMDDLAAGVVFPDGWSSSAKPSRKLVDALGKTRALVDEQEALKIRELGLTPAVAEARVAKMGAVYREAANDSGLYFKPGNEFINQKGETFPKTVLNEAFSHMNAYDKQGNVVGSIVYDARPGKEKIYVESVYVDPKQRGGIEALSGLVKQLLADGRPLDADFENAKLAKVFAKVSEGGKPRMSVGDTPVPSSLEELRKAQVAADVAQGVKVPERAMYMPAFTVDKGQPKGQTRGVTVRRGQFGVPKFVVRDKVPEINSEFTGASIKLGTIRLDTTNVVSEVAGRAARGAIIQQEYKRLVNAGVPSFTRDDLVSGRMVAVRKIEGVPDDLRKVFLDEDTALTAEELAALGGKEGSELWGRLVPDVKSNLAEIMDNKDQFVAVPAAAIPPGARTLKTLAPWAQKALQKANFPIRMAYFFTRPAYALNMLGSTGMTIIQQGVFAPPNMMKAIRATEIYGGKNARTMAALMGSGKIVSYIDEAYSLRAERAIAHGWGKLNDEKFRVSALIHELNRRGYKSVDEVDAILHAKDEAGRAIRNEAVDAARDAMVNFTNLNPIEAEFLKHVIFVYPWMSRSLVWSIDTMLDRPITTDFLAQLGEMQASEDPIWNQAPEWFKRMGMFSIGWNDDGTPKTINASSVNTFQTLGDAFGLIDSAVNGSQTTSLSDSFGPIAQYMKGVVTGRNDFGQSYEESAWLGSAREVLSGIPQLAAAKRAKGKETKDVPFDVADRDSLAASIKDGLKRTVFTPGWLNGYGMLLAGGLSPRGLDEEAKVARYWADLPAERRQELMGTVLSMALDVQGEALGRKVPEQVREAVQLGSDMVFTLEEYEKENPLATPLDLSERAVKFFEDSGRLDAAGAAKARKEMAKGRFTAGDHETFRSRLVNDVTGNVLPQWDSDVKSLALFIKPDGGEDFLQARVDYLAENNLIPKTTVTATPEQRVEAGREYVKYKTERVLMELEINDARTSEADRIRLRAEAIALDDKFDKPYVVDGKEVLPSILRVAWTDLDPVTQESHKAAAVQKPWGSLSKFDKTVLGVKVSDDVQAGWEAYNKVVARYRAENPGETLDKDQKLDIAKQIEKLGAKGFTKDYVFSSKSLAERLTSLDVYKKSKFREQWDQVLAQAKVVVDAVGSGEADSAQMRAAWKDWTTGFYRAAQKQEPGFYKELLRYDRILYKLVG